jgi:hypothetical protein
MSEEQVNISFKFTVSFLGGAGNLSPNPEHSEKIINWYLDYIGDLDDEGIDKDTLEFKLVEDTHNIYKCTYTMKKEKAENLTDRGFRFIHQLIVDPDEDGNYPIEMDDENFLVCGTLLEDEEKEIVNQQNINEMISSMNIN